MYTVWKKKVTMSQDVPQNCMVKRDFQDIKSCNTVVLAQDRQADHGIK